MSDVDSALLSDAAEKLFGSLLPSQPPAMAVSHDREAWDTVEASGFCDLLRPVATGGADGSAGNMCDVVLVAGRHALHLPVVSTMIARSLLDAAKVDVPAGPLALGFVSGEYGARRVEWTAGGDARVPVAAVLLGDNGARMELLSGQAPAVRNIAGDLVRRLDPGQADRLGQAALAPPVAQRHLMLAALGQSALITGALKRVLEMSVQYVSDRSIFGKKMKSFQTIQHLVAVAAEEVCATEAITRAAAAAFDEPMGEVLVAASRARAADAIDTVNATAHQLHGAMGFTLDFPLQRWTKLLWSWRDQHGSAVEWRVRVGRTFLGLGADELWAHLSGTKGRTV